MGFDCAPETQKYPGSRYAPTIFASGHGERRVYHTATAPPLEDTLDQSKRNRGTTPA